MKAPSLEVSAARPLVLALVAAFAPAALSAEPPPLVPRAVLFGNPVKKDATISPDGTRLAYLAPDAKGVLNIWVRTLGRTDDAPVSTDARRPILIYRWAEDGAHLLYLQDSDGDENWHVYSVDLATRESRDLTPFSGVKSQNLLTSPRKPGEILVGLNRRDRMLFDMYRVDLATGAVKLEARNPGDVIGWAADRDLAVRAATAFEPDTAATVLRVRDTGDGAWRELARWAFEDGTMFGQVNGGSVVAGFSADGRSLAVVSAAASDTARLVWIDSTTGRETGVIAEHPQSDVTEDGGAYPDERPLVLRHPATQEVQAVGFEHTKPEWRIVDAALAPDFARLRERLAGFPLVTSRTRDDKRWVLAEIADDGPVRYHLYERAAGTLELLFVDRPDLARYRLAKHEPVTITARDGLKLVGYLTLPPGVPPKNLPLVLLPHGGPWARDFWGFDASAQLLANRGYATLQVNFRGSTGFGKRFLNAGNHQFGLGMQDDLVDGVKWAVAEGIADPKRLAVMGGSAGGYATLRAITETPDLFACAVDVVGPSELRTLFESMPAYWGAVKTRWRRRMGDVEHDDALNRRLSPLYHVDRIQAPLLVAQGANDPRVNVKHSDQIVRALREQKRDVTYVVYPDEGHGFARPENEMDFTGRMEEFLARCLGGRAEPAQPVPGSTAELR